MAQAEPQDLALRDYVSSIGAFFLLNKKGKLLALRGVQVSDDLSTFLPKAADADLTALYPLVKSISHSSIVMSVAYGESPQVHYLMQVNMGGSKQTLRAPGKTMDIITNSLESDTFPIIAMADLERSVKTAREKGGALNIPIRVLELRGSLPERLLTAIKEIFVDNARGGRDKGEGLQDDIALLRETIRDTILSDYLGKCMWLDKEAGRLGTLSMIAGEVQFNTVDSDDPELSSFLVVLEKDHYGEYVLDFREFARVLPKIAKDTPWVGPTLHIYSEAFRKEFDLQEHYSLYNGFRALTAHGTPVVMLDGQDPMTEPSEVRYVQVSHRSANVLQGRILDGDVLNEGVRDFTSRDLVWKT
ncbi:MAG: hypothetical protein AAF458_16865 [Pseudomonadota bacterium]